MLEQKRELVQQHIKTHTERSEEDVAAVNTLNSFLYAEGKINTDFSSNDKWPNHDGTLEFVPDPDLDRRPKQCFYVQIKGTKNYTPKDGAIKYLLPDLAFPAFICNEVTRDPGLLFVVLNPKERGKRRVFWRYMSVQFLNSIDFSKSSCTITFSPESEILDTDESVNAFCRALDHIADHHAYINTLRTDDYTVENVIRLIKDCDEQIEEYLINFSLQKQTRDKLSMRLLTRMNDLSAAALLLNSLKQTAGATSIRLAWEQALLDRNTKYLSDFYQGMQLVNLHIPEEGQSERLMLKYYDFLWSIREFLQRDYDLSVLKELEKFPLRINTLDQEYYAMAAATVQQSDDAKSSWSNVRYYVQKQEPFYVEGKRYYEVTLQLTGIYATKYNRVTVYTRERITTYYSVQIKYINTFLTLWDVTSPIKVVTQWKVSIDPRCLNRLAAILKMPAKLSSNYGEYRELMDFLTKTGLSLLDLIDLKEINFSELLDKVYEKTNTHIFREIITSLHDDYRRETAKPGGNVIRYLLLHLREETLEAVYPVYHNNTWEACPELLLSKKCAPFDKSPFISNLVGSKTNAPGLTSVLTRAVGRERCHKAWPYLYLKQQIVRTGELYFPAGTEAFPQRVAEYNESLDEWEQNQGYEIRKNKDGLYYIDAYEKSTLSILKRFLSVSQCKNNGQEAFNAHFLRENEASFTDPLKVKAVKNAFVQSRLLLIYGAAGTGKTTLMNYLSDLMSTKNKLFLAKTHTALQNLKRRINNPGAGAVFSSIDRFARQREQPDYDIIFVDECSTIDNRTMELFLQKIKPDTFLVLAGDIYQIEAIEFGNWFFYAKDIIQTDGAMVELLDTWRTKDATLKDLWSEVRNRRTFITEKLVINGPFSEDLGENVFTQLAEDEVVLCLNYDGKFGLNNMNNYFQSANPNNPAYIWQEWRYKVGDPVLFNETRRFPSLYNNLKGRIAAIQKEADRILFTMDVECFLTENDCRNEEIEFVQSTPTGTRIRFSVYAYEDSKTEDNEELRKKTVVPFQLAYAISIHKAQGLEYDAVKIIIPSSNAEKITHGIFYTAITRAKKILKLYWSSETMQAVIAGFSEQRATPRSLEYIKQELGV